VKRAIAIIVAAAAAYAGYRWYDGTRAPVQHYIAFAEKILHRDFNAASEMTDGIPAANLEKQGTQEHIGAGPQMFQKLFPSRYTVESQETAADGTLTLHAVQLVYFNPVGVESAVRPAMIARMNQTVGLRKTSSGWKVTSFENKFASMDSTSSR